MTLAISDHSEAYKKVLDGHWTWFDDILKAFMLSKFYGTGNYKMMKADDTHVISLQIDSEKITYVIFEIIAGKRYKASSGGIKISLLDHYPVWKKQIETIFNLVFTK